MKHTLALLLAAALLLGLLLLDHHLARGLLVYDCSHFRLGLRHHLVVVRVLRRRDRLVQRVLGLLLVVRRLDVLACGRHRGSRVVVVVLERKALDGCVGRHLELQRLPRHSEIVVHNPDAVALNDGSDTRALLDSGQVQLLALGVVAVARDLAVAHDDTNAERGRVLVDDLASHLVLRVRDHRGEVLLQDLQGLLPLPPRLGVLDSGLQHHILNALEHLVELGDRLVVLDVLERELQGPLVLVAGLDLGRVLAVELARAKGRMQVGSLDDQGTIVEAEVDGLAVVLKDLEVPKLEGRRGHVLGQVDGLHGRL